MQHKMHLSSHAKALPKNSLIIVPVAEGKTLKLHQAYSSHKKLLQARSFTGTLGTSQAVTLDDQDIIFLGIGNKSSFTFPALHNSFGDIVRAYLGKVQHICLVVDGFSQVSKDNIIYEAAYMLDLASYQFHTYKTKPDSALELVGLHLIGDDLSKKDAPEMEKARLLTDAVRFARDHVNHPSNIATPQFLAYALKSDSYKKALKVEIFDHKKILKLGMNLVDAVGRGSANAPYFVKITYTGDKKLKGHTALVGKGVTFDTGGVQSKPDFSMNSMKGDMGGAALVMGVMHALATLKPAINVMAYIPLVENAEDGNSFKPDDVYTAFDGTTVEVVHTDAEGRLILADALAYASHDMPTEIFDFATLTGAVSIAVGSEYAATMGTNQRAMDTLRTLGNATGEKVWQLPLDEEYRKNLKSDIADIASLSKARMLPGTIIAGLFLSTFVGKDIPWVHMDIAAVASRDKPQGLHSHFSSGFGVRLMYEYLTQS